MILDTCALGILGAFAAQALMFLLRLANTVFLVHLAHYEPPGLPPEGRELQEVVGSFYVWLVPLSTTLGGLLVGLLTQWLAPEAEGHGTGNVVQAFHRAEGYLRARVGPVKLLASAITIGSGGSGGREGPVALVTAGFASWYAQLTGRSDAVRRQLVLVGMAAGLAAIFRSPVGTALFAIEVLYSDMEFETGALLYTMLASIVAYAVNGLFVGYEPLFRTPANIALAAPYDYAIYVLLGVGAGLVGALAPTVFYRTRDLFRLLPVPPFLRPAIGGLAMGLLALAVPQVIGGGYGWMQEAIDGKLVIGVMAVLVFAKMVALALTVSSGGSGGVFAPTLFVGAMFGATVAQAFHEPTAPFAVVGMAAVFGAAAHVPIATLMMVTEMTGGYTLLVPAALAVLLSYLVQSRLVASAKYRSLYESQVNSRADSPALHAEHLAIALRILKERGPAALQLDRSDLLPLLRLGLPVDLEGGKRLMIGVVRAQTPFAGRVIESADGSLDEHTQIVAVLRGEHMLVARPGVQLEPGDRLLLLTSMDAARRLARELDAW